MDRPIRELDSITIDKIAAGEVVERPVHVVKELVENAIDAGADAVTVEIENGGISLIRVTDNGKGIPADQVRTAFLRHATSKIVQIEDLFTLHSLGFRGEALSSIAAVSRVEMITRRTESLTGTRYVIEGARELALEEVGAPEGTTILMRDLFFNTPAREKFLKKPQTEGTYVAEFMEHISLAHPEVAFRFIVNRADRFHTAGNGDLKENIYRIYGREMAAHLVDFDFKDGDLSVTGFLGEPASARGSRSHEIFFVNGRYIRDKILQAALEEGYRAYLMQHRFPFAVLHVTLPPDEVDVNVHPSKLEVRFSDPQRISSLLTNAVAQTLHAHEMIPDVPQVKTLTAAKPYRVQEEDAGAAYAKLVATEPFERIRREQAKNSDRERDAEAEDRVCDTEAKDRDRIHDAKAEDKICVLDEAAEDQACVRNEAAEAEDKVCARDAKAEDKICVLDEAAEDKARISERDKWEEDAASAKGENRQESFLDRLTAPEAPSENGQNASLAREKEAPAPRILSEESRREYRIIGQLFDTFWLMEYRDKLLLMDQHAAHEKVNYERMMKRYHEKSPLSQMIAPPVLLALTPAEAAMLEQFAQVFADLGFEIDEMGERSIVIRGVPVDLYGADNEVSFFLEILDELAEETAPERDPRAVTGRIAGMACKASVKGNTRMSLEEVNALLDEMLTLENPYHCPHGRPTIVTMTRAEIEKRFKRIVD